MRSRFLVVAVAIIAIAPNRASAHDLQAKVRLFPDAVVVEAGFEDEPAQNAKVVIVNAAGKEVASGKTDERGVCRLPRLGPGKYFAKVESIGHRDEVGFDIAGAASSLEFFRERPNQTIGLAVGFGGLLLATGAYWWIRRRKAA